MSPFRFTLELGDGRHPLEEPLQLETCLDDLLSRPNYLPRLEPTLLDDVGVGDNRGQISTVSAAKCGQPVLKILPRMVCPMV